MDVFIKTKITAVSPLIRKRSHWVDNKTYGQFHVLSFNLYSLASTKNFYSFITLYRKFWSESYFYELINFPYIYKKIPLIQMLDIYKSGTNQSAFIFFKKKDKENEIAPWQMVAWLIEIRLFVFLISQFDKNVVNNSNNNSK